MNTTRSNEMDLPLSDTALMSQNGCDILANYYLHGLSTLLQSDDVCETVLALCLPPPYPSAVNSALASCRSAVSNPSVNQL